MQFKGGKITRYDGRNYTSRSVSRVLESCFTLLSVTNLVFTHTHERPTNSRRQIESEHVLRHARVPQWSSGSFLPFLPP